MKASSTVNVVLIQFDLLSVLVDLVFCRMASAVEAAAVDGPPKISGSCGESCENDPNFASICGFLDQFGDLCDIVLPPIADLAAMLENVEEGMRCLVAF